MGRVLVIGILVVAIGAFVVWSRDDDPATHSAAARPRVTSAAPAPTPTLPAIHATESPIRAYRDGKPHGRWTVLDRDGRVKHVAEFSEGRLLTIDGHRVKPELADKAAAKLLAESDDDLRSSSRAAIEDGVVALRPALTTCGKQAAASGFAVRVRFVVGTDGTVADASANVGGEHRELAACIEAAARSAKFEPTDTGLTFTYPFVL